MKNIKSAVVILTLMLVGTFLVVSNSQADTIATVEIYKAKIESQDGNKLKISFDIFNEQNIQPGIRYSIELDKKINEEDADLVDQKSYPEVLTLGPGERVHKVVDYEIPSYLSGEFEVWVLSDSENGMPLGQGHAGSVTVNGSGNNIDILADSCNVRVEGEDKTYSLVYGVDSASSEKLILNCKVKNGFSTEIAAVPSFDTFLRNTYGDKISSAKQTTVKLAAGEEKSVDFIIPKAEKPQAYDAVLVFLDSNGKGISNKITAHYVVQGQSASIRTINFDKDSYVKGETAKVFFRWVGNADSFEGSRKGDVDNSYVLEITVKDGSSGVCSDLYQEKLGPDTLSNMNLDINIKKDCPSPVSLAVLKDEKGNILDSQEYKLAGQSAVESPVTKVGDKNNTENETSGSSTSKLILEIVAFLTVISLILIVYSKFKTKKGGINMLIIFMIMGGLLFVGAAKQASAKTLSVDTQEKKTCKSKYNIVNSDAEYSVGLDDDTYNVGDDMELSSRVTKKAKCSNGDTKWRVRASFDDTWGSGDYSSDGDIGLVSSYDGSATSKSKTREVERNPDGEEPGGSPGGHYVSFAGSVYNPDDYDSGSQKSRCEAFKNGVKDDESISYTVRNPKKVNITVSGPGSVNGGGSRSITVNEGDSFTLNASPNSGSTFSGWSGSCSGTGSCSKTMGTSNLNVTATFTALPPPPPPPPPTPTLTVNVTGTGNGNVSGGAMTNCNKGNQPCTMPFPSGSINLSAVANGSSNFGAWSGCTSSSGTSCTVTQSGSTNFNVTVTFNTKTVCSCSSTTASQTCSNQMFQDSCGALICSGTLSCPLWREVQP